MNMENPCFERQRDKQVAAEIDAMNEQYASFVRQINALKARIRVLDAENRRLRRGMNEREVFEQWVRTEASS